jgi:hypothetical protein
MVRDLPVYRRDAFATGLTAAGYDVVKGQPPVVIDPRDSLVIWNRYGVNDVLAKRFEKAGAPVFVTENGFLDIPGARKTFALALNRHNGLGQWPVDPARAALLPDPAPWRDVTRGDALLLPQRGIGVPGVAMPRSWPTEITARLRAAGFGGRVRMRPHPGSEKNPKPFERDLEGVAFAVTWGSGAGVKALMLGCPVFYELRGWVGQHAATCGVATWSTPWRGDRGAMLAHVANAQWSDVEIASGEPFTRLLNAR